MSMTSRRMQMATSGQAGQSVTTPEFVWTITGNYNSMFDLRSRAIQAGWDSVAPLRVILDGCKILAASTSSRALYISGSFPNGITLEPKTGTVIMGRGGTSTYDVGARGGDAIYVDTNINLTIHLDSSNIANIPSAVAFLGGGGAGGTAYMRDRDAGSKITSYTYLNFIGGGGCGGGGTPLASGPTSIGVASSLGSTSGTIPSTLSYTMYTPNSTGVMPNGYGCVGIWNSSSGEMSANSSITGNVGGTTVPTVNYTQTFDPFYYNTLYFVRLASARNYTSQGSSTASFSSSINAAFFTSGNGGGYGASGSYGYQWSTQLTSTDHIGAAFAGGAGGKAIIRQDSSVTVTFTGDIYPSSSFGSTNRVVLLGGIT